MALKFQQLSVPVQIFHCNAILGEQMVKQNAYDKDDYAQEFGIKISDRLASVEARILPAPRVGWTHFCLFWPFSALPLVMLSAAQVL